MDKQFKSAYDAALFASDLTDEWITEGEEVIRKDALLSMMSVADEEGEIDEDNAEFYYIVDECGSVGVTSNGGKTVTWVAKSTRGNKEEVQKRVADSAVSGAEKPINKAKRGSKSNRPHGEVGYSDVVNSEEFKQAVKKRKISTLITLAVVIALPIVILAIYTSITKELGVGYGVLIGVCISAVIFVLYCMANLKDKIQKSWEGTVIDKYEKKVRVVARHASDKYYSYRTHFFVIMKEDNGKKHKLEEKTSLAYNYFKKGEKVRYHGRMNLLFPYEKFDKSKDEHVICAFCRTQAPITDKTCPKCHNPLLK